MYLPSIFKKNLSDEFFSDFLNFPVERMNAPAADIKEFNDHFEIEIELPGYAKEDVTAELKDGYLVIDAKHTEEKEDKDDKGNYIRRERRYGSFRRSFYVGDQYQETDFKGSFDKGILSFNLPKKEQVTIPEEKKQIEIS